MWVPMVVGVLQKRWRIRMARRARNGEGAGAVSSLVSESFSRTSDWWTPVVDRKSRWVSFIIATGVDTLVLSKTLPASVKFSYSVWSVLSWQYRLHGLHLSI